MRGSWPVLLSLGGVFLAGFWLSRSSSLVLRAEQDADAARALAAQNELSPACVLALRAAIWSCAGSGPIDAGSHGDGLADGAADAAAFARRVAQFARLRDQLGEPLAAHAVLVDEAGARAALAAGGGDPMAAWRRFRSEPAALPALAFVQFRDRFLERRSGRAR